MSPQSIFSSYRGGENRVTSTMLAVFERVGLGLTERIVAAAAEDPGLTLTVFANQPSAGGSGVPDGEIRASFRYLIETKIAPNAVRVDQLRRHLRRLDSSYSDERLLVITPDAEEPPEIGRVEDSRVLWIGFGLLAQAIGTVVQDPNELASEQQRFLLRELVSFIETEGLTETEDTVIVAARFAYPNYLSTSAYTCQPNRPIRPVSHIGFYTRKHVMPEIAKVLERLTDVTLDPTEIPRFRRSSDPTDQRLAAVIDWWSQNIPEAMGEQRDVYILSAPGDKDTVVLDRPIEHTATGAWTQSQRYTSIDRLQGARTTADL